MILLDTNVVSEIVAPKPDARVAAWVKAQPRRNLVTSEIVRAELLYGLAVMPVGKRRNELVAMLEGVFDEIGTVLPFTDRAAAAYASLAADRRHAGRPIGGFDGLIAATALAAGAAVATRDTAGFEGCGLTLIDPWHAG